MATTTNSHFTTLEQEHEAAQLGMWLFLATEAMLFGGLFTAYTVYRTLYPDGFAEGSRHLDVTLATINTLVLIVSSGVMALAVNRARNADDHRPPVRVLAVTAALGVVFLALKAVEYQHHLTDGLVPGLAWQYAGPRTHEVELFMLAYFSMTGLHAVHLTAGIGLVAWLAIWRPRATAVELTGLYWNFVDLIWVFLLPLLYLYGVR